MDFQTTPSLSLTVPTGAGPGQARTVIGNDIPQELIDFYNSVNSPYALGVISVDLMYDEFGDYFYQAHLEALVGSGEPAFGAGVVSGGVVVPRLFLDSNGFANPTNYISDTQYSDTATGSTYFGSWTTCPLRAGWSNLAGTMPLSVKRLPVPDRSALIYGRVSVPAGAGNGAIVADMPDPSLRPAVGVQFAVQNWGATNATNGSVETDGTIRLWGTYSGNVSFNALVPLDGYKA